jgi:mannose-1-phosphate guanylyltransferase
VQALVLAGGEGTRLRPLTLSLAKPVMPLAGRPFLTFMLDWLYRHGVDDVLLSCGYRSHDVERVLGHDHRGMQLRYVVEDEPLGTAGPLRLAADEGVLADRVLVLNGDCLTDIDLTAEIARHEAAGARATLGLVAVDDTSSYGVVPTLEGGEVEAFLEKRPGPAPTNRINAGAYVLEREVVELVPSGRAVSIEREVFPELVGNGLYGFDSDDYWIDIGTPERYLEATYDLLAGRVESELPARDETASLVYEPCITSGARIGPLSVIGRHCSVGFGSTVERAVLHDSVRVGQDCSVFESVLAEGVRVEDGARVGPDAIVGAGAVVAEGAVVGQGTRIDPGARVE